MPRMSDEKRYLSFAGVAHDLADGGRVVVLDASSERERQQFLRQRAGKQLGTAQQRVFEARHAAEFAGAGQRARRVDRLAVAFVARAIVRPR